MSAEEAKPGGESAPARPGILDVLTGNIGKITALVGAVAGLVAAWQALFGQLFEEQAPEPAAPRVCVEVDAQDFPQAVKYSDWKTTPIRVKGRNNCDKPLGVYATFVRRQSSEPSFVLGVPYDSLPGCDRGTPLLEPKCWDRKKPVPIDRRGEWEWETRPPPLWLLGDPGSIEEIAVTWEVRDLDQPTDDPLATSSVTIKLIDDRTR